MSCKSVSFAMQSHRESILCPSYIYTGFLSQKNSIVFAVQGYKLKNAFIATQGPVPDSVPDFWRMVWEQNSATIVMVTNLEERGRVRNELFYLAIDIMRSFSPLMLQLEFTTLESRSYWRCRKMEV